MERSFSKYVACGNDFILIDDREGSFPVHNRALLIKMCQRQHGIGADGVILLQRSSRADLKMRIFNADGSEAEMCGNGIRCLKKFAEELGMKRASYSIETLDRIVTVWQQDNCVTVAWGELLSPFHSENIRWGELDLKVHYVHTGVPHAVIFDEFFDELQINEIGSYIRHHPRFSPRGTNVNIAKRLPSGEIAVRTYERGVEAETMACGTGATAVALTAASQFQLSSPIKIRTKLDELMTIGFKLDGQKFTEITLTGPAYCSFKGLYHI